MINIIIILIIFLIIVLSKKKKEYFNKNNWFVKRNFIKKKELLKFTNKNLIKEIGNNNVKIKLFNDHLIKEDIGSYAYSSTKKFTLNKILKNKSNDNIKYQYISLLSNTNPVDLWFNKNTKKIISKINKSFNKKNSKYKVKLRINTVPWIYRSHFDCESNYSVILNGSRTFLLFKYDEDINKIRNLLLEIANLNVKEIISILKKYNIKDYEIIKLNTGDLIYIPIKIWHFVEITEKENNIGIMINFIFTNNIIDSINCSKKFNKIWSKQAKKCKFNKCL